MRKSCHLLGNNKRAKAEDISKPCKWFNLFLHIKWNQKWVNFSHLICLKLKKKSQNRREKLFRFLECHGRKQLWHWYVLGSDFDCVVPSISCSLKRQVFLWHCAFLFSGIISKTLRPPWVNAQIQYCENLLLVTTKQTSYAWETFAVAFVGLN